MRCLCSQGWLGRRVGRFKIRSVCQRSRMHTLRVPAHGWDGQHVQSPSKTLGRAEWHHSHWAIGNCPLMAEGCVHNEEGGPVAGALVLANGT